MRHACTAARALVVLIVLAPLSPAWAQSAVLQGKWVGTLRCRAFDGTKLSPPTATATLAVSQSGNYFAAQIEDTSGVKSYNGEVIRELSNDSRFQAVLIECRSNSNMNNYSEVVNVKGLSVDSTGKLVGDSIFRGLNGEIGKCRWSYQRVSGSDPHVPFCP